MCGLGREDSVREACCDGCFSPRRPLLVVRVTLRKWRDSAVRYPGGSSGRT